jgi:polyhydroxybutyrate depolymerase
MLAIDVNPATPQPLDRHTPLPCIGSIREWRLSLNQLTTSSCAKAFQVTALIAVLLGLVACGGGGDSSSSSSSNSSSSASSVTAPSALAYASPQTFIVGTAIATLSPTVTGVVASYSVSPALPAGLLLNASSGSITGTPTAVTTTASYTITAQNSGGSTTFNLSITVNAATQFPLEPTTSTTIGVAQVISVFAALQNSGAAFPAYLDASSITWASSNPGVATINSNGVVTGLGNGSTTITAQYQTFSSQLNVTVSGILSARTLAVTGQGTRRYSIYVPPFTNANPHPALVSIHGGGGTAMLQAATSQLNQFAQQHNFYVVYLEGTGTIQTFNGGACCGTAQTQNIDDVLYVQSVLNDVEANFNVDANKEFATGFSNGGIMTHRLACTLSNRFAAVAAVSGGSGEFDNALNRYYTCNPARPIPILHIQAGNDRNYPFAGGVGAGISSTNFYSIDSTIADWRTRNNVTPQVTLEQVTLTTTCYHYTTRADTSKPSAPVTLCKINPPDVYDAVNQIVFGGGHSWPGGMRSPSANSDVPVTDFSANAYMWAFFGQ